MTKQSGIDIVDGRQGKVLLCYVIQKCRRQIVSQSTATEATPSCSNIKEVHPVICTSPDRQTSDSLALHVHIVYRRLDRT